MDYQLTLINFWIDIKNLLTDSILYAINSGELSIKQKRGIFTLLPKKIKIGYTWKTVVQFNY